jgi:hypothetical protein
MPNQEPLKDENGAHPVADSWRPVIREIVKAFAEGDYELTRGIPSVVAPSAETVKQARTYVANFGERLAELPDEAWESSVSQWMETHWEIIVDLWTLESGRSDLVLDLRVYEAGAGFRFEIDSVYVP